MATIKSSLVCAFLCLVLLVGCAFAATPATELLYVQQGQNVVTYTVNTKTAITKKLGTIFTAYSGAQPMTINRSGSFLYLLGFSSSVEYFTVYSVTAAGVPNPKPVQTLIVKPALHQFFIHPNGTIAYAMFYWTQVVNGNYEYASDVVLFTINPKTGKLTNTTKNVANFPLNDSWWTTGMAGKGTSLRFASVYFGSGHWFGVDYYQSTINPKTGALGPQTYFWQDDQYYAADYSAFADTLIAQIDNQVPPYSTISIFPNASPSFTCTSTMLAVCGDQLNYTAPWMHPSGAYIFVSDRTLNEVPILYISLPLQKLEASGASIPGIPASVAFSRDGLLVFAVEGSQILTYVFNPHSGLLTAKTTIKAPGVLSILPWL